MTELNLNLAAILKRQFAPVGVINSFQRHCHDIEQQTCTNRLMQRLELPEMLLRHYRGGILQSGAIGQRFHLRRVDRTDWNQTDPTWRLAPGFGTDSQSTPAPIGSANLVVQPEFNPIAVPLLVSESFVNALRVQSEFIVKPSASAIPQPLANPVQSVKPSSPASAIERSPATPFSLKPSGSSVGEFSVEPFVKPPVNPALPGLLPSDAASDSPAAFRIRRAMPRSAERQPAQESLTPASPIPQSGLPLMHRAQPTASQESGPPNSESFQQPLASSLSRIQPDAEQTSPVLKVKPMPVIRANRSATATELISSMAATGTAPRTLTAATGMIPKPAPGRSENQPQPAAEPPLTIPRINAQPHRSTAIEETHSSPLQPVKQKDSAAKTAALPLVMPFPAVRDRPPETAHAAATADAGASDPGSDRAVVQPPQIPQSINIEKVAEQVSRLLSRRLTIERERRGLRP